MIPGEPSGEARLKIPAGILLSAEPSGEARLKIPAGILIGPDYTTGACCF